MKQKMYWNPILLKNLALSILLPNKLIKNDLYLKWLGFAVDIISELPANQRKNGGKGMGV